MDTTDSTAAADRRQEGPAPVLQRFDLEPEPIPQPTIQDVLEGIADALEQACELAEPRRTAARALTITTRVRAASRQPAGAAELLVSLGRLVQDWRAS